MEMSMLGDIDASTEDDKLRYALELAVHQVTAKTRNAEGGPEDLDSTKDTIVVKKDKKKKKLNKVERQTKRHQTSINSFDLSTAS